MRLIGVLGGMSPESTMLYYRYMNEAVAAATKNPAASARIVLHSINFSTLAPLQQAGDWDGAGRLLADAASGLVVAGAELVIISANTMHNCVEQVRTAIQGRPLIHIGDVIVEQAGKQGAKLLLLGTRYTMELPFLSDYITARGIEVKTPNQETRSWLQTVIYEELTRGIVTPASKSGFATLLEKAKQDGFDAVILGCTELGMLVDKGTTTIRLIDTARAHAQAAVAFALSDETK